MSKRPFPHPEMMEPIDLDKALRPPKYQHGVEGASDSITTDPDNLMDNWYLSSLEMQRQRDSKDYRERDLWESRRRLNPGQYEIEGSWRYSRTTDFKSWKPTGLTRWARGSTIRLPAYREDKPFSEIYRIWLEGRKSNFLDDFYNRYAVNNFIPEEIIWRLFRCVVSELIPTGKQWENAPFYLLEEPDTIWQAGKCIFQTLTRGRFWSEDYNALNPVDNGEKFGEYKQKVLQKNYSKNLMKYVLACISSDPTKRPSRKELLCHFDTVLSIFDGTYPPRPVEEPSFTAPYIPTNRFIPNDLTPEEGAVYEALLEVKEEREKLTGDNKQRIPRILIVTDLAKDYDDLLAMMVLKELHRLGLVHLEGFVANLMPASDRALFGRGALDSLGCPDIKVAVGTVGDPKRVLDPFSHEFDNTSGFWPSKDRCTEDSLPRGQDLMEEIFTRAVKNEYKVTILTISSLMDLAIFAQDHAELLKKGVSNVILQGGYRIIKERLTADFAAQNNKFDEEGATAFHDFMQENGIPSTAWTKVAAQAVPIYNTLFEYLEQTGHPLVSYLRNVQVRQDVSFYERACSEHPYAPYMTQEWYVSKKSTWFAAGHEPDEEYPKGEDMVPYFTKVVAYDALAAVGSSGEDVLEKFALIKPIERRKDVDDKTHRLVGIPAVKEEQLPQEENFDADKMGLVITALLKGSILAKQQELPSAEPKHM